MKTIRKHFTEIMNSSIFRLNGPEIDLCAELASLANAVHAEPDEVDWSLGEFLECSLDALIVGAYGALSEWHSGQWSPEYAALCALGKVFKPGCTSGPEPDSGEHVAYEMICAYFEAKKRPQAMNQSIQLPHDYTITIEWERDDDTPPWKHCDGHGIISEWTTRDKRPGERILSQVRQHVLYYDAQATVAKATAEGWGLSAENLDTLTRKLGRTPTRRQIVARAIESDFDNLRKWCLGLWTWVYYSATITDPDGVEVWRDTCGMIDSPSIPYFEVEIEANAREWLAGEMASRHDAECRDIVTG